MIERLTRVPLVPRGVDQYGSGAYGAPRGDHTHHGIDLCCTPGDPILSHVSGTITKYGYPYDPYGPKGRMRYVEVTDSERYRHRFFYVRILGHVGSAVRRGDIIGHAQNLQAIYPGITDHIHYEVKPHRGGYEDPARWLDLEN